LNNISLASSSFILKPISDKRNIIIHITINIFIFFIILIDKITTMEESINELNNADFSTHIVGNSNVEVATEPKNDPIVE